MARLNPSQPSAVVFTIHEDEPSEHGTAGSKPSKKNKARRNRYLINDTGSESNGDAIPRRDVKTKQPGSRARTKSNAKERNDERALADRFTTLKINDREFAHDEENHDANAEPSTTKNSPAPARRTVKKNRKPLGSTRANPLLLPLSSSSSKKERYSLTNLENFHPKSENWEDDDDARGQLRRSRKKDSGLEPTRVKASRKGGRDGRRGGSPESEDGSESENEFDSLDDFIVSDNDEISYHDSAGELDETEEEEEEEIIPKQKTSRRLFRGRRPRQGEDKRDSVEKHNNIATKAKALDIVNELSTTTTLSREKEFSSHLHLKPTSTSPSSQDTPIKKTQQSIMDGDDVFQERRDDSSSSITVKKQTSVERPTTPPTSPSKPRLQSPSKAKNRIPTSPYKSNIDIFWDQEAINDWNDTFSPRKTPARQGLAKFGIFSDHEDDKASAQKSPTTSPTKAKRSPSRNSPTKSSLAAAKREQLAKKREFDRTKASLAENFFKELDDLVTDGEIQRLAASTGGVRIVWSKTLNKTAGRANWKREVAKPSANVPSQPLSASFRRESGNTSPSSGISTTGSQSTKVRIRHHASIELAEKVIDNDDRLLNTLAHEYCHLANFMISNVRDNPHGASFKAWAGKCHAALGSHPVYSSKGIKITTKHSYEINYKYLWCCEVCGCEYGRHSKSIDPKKSRCGKCKGALVQVRPKPRKTKEKTPVENKENRDPLSLGSDSSLASKKEGRDVIDLTETLRVVSLEKPS